MKVTSKTVLVLRWRTNTSLSDNAKTPLKLDNQNAGGPLALRSWGPLNLG